MATIQNDRDILLQAAAVRVVPVPIPISQVTGLQSSLNTLSDQTKRITISAPSNNFYGLVAGTTPASITLTASLQGGLTGTVTWSVASGTATLTPSGNTCAVAGGTIVGTSVTVRAAIGGYEALYTLSRLGAVAGNAYVNLASDVTGALAAGNVTGLGALALLNTIDLNTQTTGALNGATRVTNLGTLAYANAIAANQIGAGTLAAGVIYAGTLNAENLTGTTISGKTLSGTNAVYVQGTDANALVAMHSSGSVGTLSVRGVFNSYSASGVSNFSVSNSGNISGGSISGGTTTDFRGNFTVRSTSTSYANIESTSSYLRFRSDTFNFTTAGGDGIMALSTDRVTVQRPFLNLLALSTDPGTAIHGDLGLYSGEVVIRISGAWYKLTKTPL